MYYEVCVKFRLKILMKKRLEQSKLVTRFFFYVDTQSLLLQIPSIVMLTTR